jgi:hypothetical protein
MYLPAFIALVGNYEANSPAHEGYGIGNYRL